MMRDCLWRTIARGVFNAGKMSSDYIEAEGEITKVGNTSRKMTFRVRGYRPLLDVSPSAADAPMSRKVVSGAGDA